MTTSITVPRALKKRIKAFGSLQEVNRWGSAVDEAIDDIIESLQQTRQSIRQITRSTGVSSVGLHASTHRPGSGTDPLNTAAHTGGYGSSATVGTGDALLRADARLKWPEANQTLANLATATWTDDAADMTLTGSLGQIKLRPSSEILDLPKWTGAFGGGVVGSILRFAANMSDFGTSLAMGVDAGFSFNLAATLSSTYRVGRFQFNNPATASIAWSGATQRILELEFGGEPIMGGTQTITERTGIKMTMRSMRGASVTITDSWGILADAWPILNTSAGSYTNAAFMKVQLPTIGNTIRRGIWLTTTGTTTGTASANTEGFYCEDITIGTARRVNYYAEGATTGTPTDVYGYYLGTGHGVGTNRYGFRATGATGGTPTLAIGFYADAQGVGTTKWSFYGNDESRMNGVQQDDNAKDVFGTGRDAEIYYDGTDLVLDPDVVGTGSVRHKGKTALEDDTTITTGKNVVLGTTGAGTKIGTATTQLLGFWNAAPVVQPATTGTASSMVAGGGAAVDDKATFTGGLGATAYRIDDIVANLKTAGILKT